MFHVTVEYRTLNSPEENEAVRERYTKSRNYGEVCSHFSDFGLCDDAMFAWAIDLGWDANAITKEMEKRLNGNLFSERHSLEDFFYDALCDAIGFIDQHLPTKTEYS